MKKIVVFGRGMMAEVVSQHMLRDRTHEIAAFVIDREWLGRGESFAAPAGLPLVAFDEVQAEFPPEAFDMFVAIGYHNLNRIRAEKCALAKAKGYALVSYVSPRANIGPWLEIGENCLVLDGVGIQPGARLGDDVWLWNNSLIGHHSTIGNHCWLAAGSTVGGKAVVGESCFFGLGATLGGDLSLGAESIVGAGALVTKSAGTGSVFVERDTELFRLDSRQFLSITRLKTLGPGGSDA